MNTKVLSMVGNLPPCRERYSAAVAMYVVPVKTATGRRWRLEREKVFIKDGQWVVRRDGNLVPLAQQPEQPAALALRDGVEGGGRWWPDVPEFLRDHGIDPLSVGRDTGWR